MPSPPCCLAAGFFLVIDATLPAEQARADWADAYSGAANQADRVCLHALKTRSLRRCSQPIASQTNNQPINGDLSTPSEATRAGHATDDERGLSAPAHPASFPPTLSGDWLQARQMIDADFDFVSRFFVVQLVAHLSLNVFKQPHDAVDADLVAHCPVIKFAVPQVMPLLNSADAPTQVVNAADADIVRLQGELRGHQQQQNSGQVGG